VTHGGQGGRPQDQHHSKGSKMYLTLNDWMMLVGLISFAGFCSYTAHEIQGAIHNYLHGEYNDF